MATKTLTLNFADANEADIVAALKANAATEANPAPTKAQAWDWFEAACKASLHDVVKRHRREEAVRVAEASVADIGVT
jgi:hypothetical protein